MPKFKVKSPISHGHGTAKKDKDGNIVNREHITDYKPGDVAEFTDAEAAELAHALEPLEVKPAKAEKPGKGGKEEDKK